MKLTQNLKRILSALLVFVLVVSMMPVTALAADNSRPNDTIFFASDLHQLPNKLTSLLKALAYEPGLVVLGGDYVDGTNKSSLSTLSDKIHSVYPDAQTFYTYGANDINVTEEGANPYAFARTGECFTGEDYYVYALDYTAMNSAAEASAASSQFLAWANNAKASKVIFVMCHMPIHQSQGNNPGGAVWMNALNQVGQTHDVVFLWGYNHLNESSADTSAYFVPSGGALTPEGGTTGAINFTYVNAGYIKSGNGTMALVNDENVTFVRYSTTGSVINTNTAERKHVGHIHHWELTDSQEATCGADGFKTFTCDCKESYTEVIPATARHTTQTVVVDATCTEKGSTTITCTVCGKSDSVESDPLGHDYYLDETISREPTATQAGFHLYRCRNCSSMYGETVSALIHTWVPIEVVNPTCTTDGYVLYACSSTLCETHTYKEEQPALGHTFHSQIDRATCEEEGLETHTCTVCGFSKSEELEPQGHAYQTVTVEATCTKEGSVTTTCANCDYYNVEILPVLGHNTQIATFAASCARTGSIVETCTACGESSTEVIPATGHTYEEIVVEATCTTVGYTKHVCTTCDSYYNSNKVEAFGHTYTKEVVAPTCTEAGFTRNTCSTCGDTTVTNNVAPLGHKYTGVAANGTMTFTCETCHDSYSETIVGGSSYEKVSKLSTDEFVIVLYSSKNYYALSHKDNQVTAVPVTVESGKITSVVTEDLLWNHNSKKLSYEDGDTTYYLTANSSKLDVAATGAATVTYGSNKLKVGTRYLRFSSNAVSLSSSSTTTYLFTQAD